MLLLKESSAGITIRIIPDWAFGVIDLYFVFNNIRLELAELEKA
jgi:hypothetical protein